MSTTIQVHERIPEGFTPEVEVSACYLEIEDKLLLLQRAPEKSEGGTWGVPAGKLEQGEDPQTAARRELHEETGILVADGSKIQHIHTLYVQKPEVHYTYHMFKVQLNDLPNIYLSDEHQNFHWATPTDLIALPLMAGAKEVLHHYKTILMRNRIGASVNAYLILKKEGKLLLHLRQNTGYCDGMWSLVAGHVEDTESATQGIIREAKEEIGIVISADHLKVAHVRHRQSNRLNVDVFFTCDSWEGEPQNCEPEKCERVEFFPLDQLPMNTVSHNIATLKAIEDGIFYSEQGF